MESRCHATLSESFQADRLCLGIPHETVVDDYQLTDRYWDATAADRLHHQGYPSIDDATWHKMLAADPSCLQAAFDEATPAALRRNFLVD